MMKCSANSDVAMVTWDETPINYCISIYACGLVFYMLVLQNDDQPSFNAI
jgi:hypothetical protein